MSVPTSPAAAAFASYFDGHFAMTPFGSVWKPVGVSLPLQHDFGFVLERVGHDAGVRRVDDVPLVRRRGRIVLHLELVLERVLALHEIEPGTT